MVTAGLNTSFCLSVDVPGPIPEVAPRLASIFCALDMLLGRVFENKHILFVVLGPDSNRNPPQTSVLVTFSYVFDNCHYFRTSVRLKLSSTMNEYVWEFISHIQLLRHSF